MKCPPFVFIAKTVGAMIGPVSVRNHQSKRQPLLFQSFDTKVKGTCMEIHGIMRELPMSPFVQKKVVEKETTCVTTWVAATP